MSSYRIALANLTEPESIDDAVSLAESAISAAGKAGARIVCFPECFVPGYRCLGAQVAPVSAASLQAAWQRVAAAAVAADQIVILGTERFVGAELRICALVINRDGTWAGFQDKVQIDPSEEAIYSPGHERQVFSDGDLKFAIAICHEGFRYPETVRWAVSRGAQLIFHPHFAIAEPGSYQPIEFADPANSFHEKALLCRAAENTCYVASVNCASEGSPTTSALVRPDGTLQCFQPYGKAGLLVADIDPAAATGGLARRLRYDITVRR